MGAPTATQPTQPLTHVLTRSRRADASTPSPQTTSSTTRTTAIGTAPHAQPATTRSGEAWGMSDRILRLTIRFVWPNTRNRKLRWVLTPANFSHGRRPSPQHPCITVKPTNVIRGNLHYSIHRPY